MSAAEGGRLHLGSNVVALLLPHDRPLLLVDEVTDFQDADTPELRAAKYITSNEPIFSGHFQALHLWPGIFTIEGLGQSCYLLFLIIQARRTWAQQGGDPAEVVEALLNLERGTRMKPGFDPELAARFRRETRALQARVGVSSAINMKLLNPVFAGCRIDYHARLVRELDQHLRFEVEASVAGTPVAAGTMTSFLGYGNPMGELAP